MKDEIKIITLGDIFKNIETEEKAFKFKDYITNLQQEKDRLNNIIEELESFLYDQKEIFRDANIKLFVAMVLDKLKELKENK